MNFERKRYNHTYMNIAPLVDVVFLLLLFFMLASHLVDRQSLQINLPESETSSPLGTDTPELIIERNGRVFLNQKQIPVDNLEEALEGVGERLRIMADREVRLDVIIRVMDQARKAGITRFDLITRQPSPG